MLETLQRYDPDDDYGCEWSMIESEEWEYVRYQSVKDLLDSRPDPIEDIRSMIKVMKENREKYPEVKAKYDLQIHTLENAIEFISDTDR